MGKKRRIKNQRAAGPTEIRWTASTRAVRATRLRAELVERWTGNPLLLQQEQARAEVFLGEALRRFTDRGVPQPLETALEWMNMDHLNPRSPYLADQIGETYHQMVTRQITEAELFVTSPAMHATTVAAAHTLTAGDVARFTLEDLPSPTGFLLLPAIQMYQQPDIVDPDELLVLTWEGVRQADPRRPGHTRPVLNLVSWFDCNGPVVNTRFNLYRKQAAELGHPFPGVLPIKKSAVRLGMVAPEEAEWHSPLNELMAGHDTHLREPAQMIGAYSGEQLSGDLDAFMFSYLFAFARLCTQKVATMTRHGDTPVRAGQPEGPETGSELDRVRVVQLRSYSPDHGEADEAAGSRYSHRWVVRVHKVNQWYPSQQVHRTLFRGPYIKGPEGAPLLAGERVYSLTR